MKKLILIGALSAATAMTGLVGCSTARMTGGRTIGRAIDDHQITDSVQDRLEKSQVYKFRNVGVSTFEGVVQLNGFVETQGQRQAAQEIAQNTPGVRQVVDNITVTPGGALTPTGRNNETYPNQTQARPSTQAPSQNGANATQAPSQNEQNNQPQSQ
jgi:BON domain